MSSKNAPRKLLEKHLLPLLPTRVIFESVQLRKERRLCALQGEGRILSGGTHLGGYCGEVTCSAPLGEFGEVAYLGAGGVECAMATAQPPAGGPRTLPWS